MYYQNQNQSPPAWQRHEGVARQPHLLAGLICRVYGVDDALLAASIAATAASAGAGMAAQSKARGEVRQTRNAELLRQQEYQRQADQVARESLAQGTREVADQQLDQGAAARQAAYARLTTPQAQPATATATPQPRGVAPKAPTATATAQSNALTAAWNRILGTAQSRLGAYDDWNLTQAIKNRRAAEKLGVLSGHARGSYGVLNTELEDALHEGDDLNTLAGALGLFGNTAGMYVATTPRR